MGTSHHEPMLRAQQEWKRHGTGAWDFNTNAPELERFWANGIGRNRDYESTITIGMRGDGHMAMSATANTTLLEHIVARQREILMSERMPESTPQIWALYKEVQEYYEKGRRVPNDVTLLWCDDNWGNLRRLPSASERGRAGGAGIYYHLDYVGDPCSYKWLLTYNIAKVREEMQLALDYGADRVWIVNVGDLKPIDFPIEFFLTMARQQERFDPDDLWNHMMDQAHIGYTGWNPPPVNVMPNIMDAPTVAGARLGMYAESPAEAATTTHSIDLPAFDNVNRQVRTLELAPLVSGPVAYRVRTSVPWIVVSHAAGTITKDMAVNVSIDWTQVPPSGSAGLITVTTPGTAEVALKVQALMVKDARGHVESGGVIATEAVHATSWHQADQVAWHILRGFGETLGGVEAYPSLAEPTLPPAAQACLEYEFTALSAARRTVEFVLAPTLPFDVDGRLRFSAALDSAPQQVLNVWNTPGLAVGSANDRAWAKAVVDGVRLVEWKAGDVPAGVHTLPVCRVDAGVALERIVIYQGARPMEYLGPAESTVAPRGRRTGAEGAGARATRPSTLKSLRP